MDVRSPEPMRPLLFTVLFWITVPAVLTLHALGAPTYPPGLGVVPLAGLLVVLIALWLALPWELAVARRRRPVTAVFLIVCVVLAYVDGSGLIAPLLLIGLGNVAQVFGSREAFGTLGVLLVLFFFGGLTYPHLDWNDALRSTLTIAVFCAFGIVAAASVRTARMHQARAGHLLDELTAARADLDRHEEQIRRLAVAEERARMAREMHDSLGHHLTVIKVDLENAERLRTRASTQAWAEVRQAKQLTVQALAETRRAVRALRPLALEGRRGSAALGELARTFDGADVRVDLRVTGPEHDLGPDTEIVLYRALQEGLTNVLRHAGAGTATAELSFPDGGARLVIADDGSGAPTEPVRQGFGLGALAERVAELGGTLTAGNRPGGGFELRVELPAGERP
ncbi:sensor histidine kinase [Umezawaea beigongshangensis]|uniref:sensor histidine kinase n=1 Tax=Umezawaea beigongshangensis TaxID=2780383 RepID=UPI0018F25A91|nr:sensor histidine kinase [Umezawaea beigongshangensis]